MQFSPVFLPLRMRRKLWQTGGFFVGRETWFLLVLAGGVILFRGTGRYVINIHKRRNGAVGLVTKKQEAEASGSQAGAKSYVQVSVNLGGLTQAAPAAKSADYRTSCNCQPIPRVEPVGSGQNCLASSLIVLPRSLLCSVCHSAGCRRYFLGQGPTLDAIPSSDRLNPIRRLDLAFLRLSTAIDRRSLLVSAEIANVQYRAVTSDRYIITRTFSAILTFFHLAAA